MEDARYHVHQGQLLKSADEIKAMPLRCRPFMLPVSALFSRFFSMALTCSRLLRAQSCLVRFPYTCLHLRRRDLVTFLTQTRAPTTENAIRNESQKFFMSVPPELLNKTGIL